MGNESHACSAYGTQTRPFPSDTYLDVHGQRGSNAHQNLGVIGSTRTSTRQVQLAPTDSF